MSHQPKQPNSKSAKVKPADRIPELVLQQLFVQRISAWDVFAASVLGLQHHPKNLMSNPNPLRIDQIADIADEMLKERDRRWGNG